MANRVLLLEERLHRVEERNRAIVEASDQQVQLPAAQEEWWHFMVNFFGTEDAIFERLRANREEFEDAFSFVSEVVPSVRGRRGWIHSNREKLQFLLVFVSQGVEVLELLVTQKTNLSIDWPLLVSFHFCRFQINKRFLLCFFL